MSIHWLVDYLLFRSNVVAWPAIRRHLMVEFFLLGGFMAAQAILPYYHGVNCRNQWLDEDAGRLKRGEAPWTAWRGEDSIAKLFVAMHRMAMRIGDFWRVINEHAIIAISGGKGRITFANDNIAFCTDVTASKAAEERMRVLSQEVERKNNDLKTSLHNGMANAVRFICAGAGKIEGLLKGLLAILQLERSGSKLGSVDASGILNQSPAPLQFQLDQSEAEVKSESLPPCLADSGMLGQQGLKSMPIIMVTATDDPEVMSQRVELGWKAFLFKLMNQHEFTMTPSNLAGYSIPVDSPTPA